MITHRNPVWAELMQLLPVMVLALPFILAGTVDLSRATSGFVGGAVLTIPVCAVVLRAGHALNPISVGTAVWLWVGTLGFGMGLAPVADALAAVQGFGLFVAVMTVGIVATGLSPQGFVGCRSEDAAWVRKASLGLLAAAALAVVWSWMFRHDIRIGGGLPFIALNVLRRVMLLRGPRP